MTEQSEKRHVASATSVMEAHFRSVLNLIAHDRRYTEGEFLDAARFIAQTAADVLGCERTSVWEYHRDTATDTRLICIAQYNATTERFSAGTVLTRDDAGSYLKALETESLLIVNNARSDPRCKELAVEYLPATNVSSLLDAGYQFDTELAGVLCCEHTGEPRNWSPAEQHFAANMGSLLTIAAERAFRRHTVIKLKEEEDRYRSLVSELPLGIAIIVDLELRFTNRSAASLTGFETTREMQGLTLLDVLPIAPEDELRQWERSVMEKNRVQPPTEYRLTLRNGRQITLEVTASPVNWLGEPALQILFRDVTESSYAQMRLRRSERLLSQAQRIARLGSWVWDIDNNSWECSLELRNLLGIHGGNPVDEPILSMAHPEDAPRVKAAQQEAIRNRQSYQITYRVRTKSGQLWLEEIGVPELGPDQQVIRIHGTSRDITRQKFAEQEARATEERFSSLGNSFPGGFIYCDLSERYLFINQTYGRWFGIDPEAYLGKTIHDLVGDEYYNDIKENLETVRSGKSFSFEREPYFSDENIERLQITYAPDVTHDGEMRGFFALLTDITGQRRVEQALRQAQKMEAMGQLTGGIAHDFNNILAILMGNLELARHSAEDAQTREYIEAALQGVDRGVSITRKLLGFARNNTPAEKQIRLNEIVDEMESIISQSVGGKIEISIETGPDLWTTIIDTGDFQDAMINLCINARDAMPDGGKLLIKTENKTLDEASIGSNPNLVPGDYVLLSVTDTGTGMALQVRDRLFEPFYTTKPEGKGTGLGMSMVFGFVNRSRGKIVVFSAEHEGTTINIYLPRSTREETTAINEQAEDALPARRESVLIVDDEKMVADVAAGILSELGYETEVAPNSEEALRRVSEGRKVDLLLSDVVMPGDKNGFELAREVVSIRPSIRVLLTSGFSKFKGIEPVDEESRALAENILSKPYNRKELSSSVRRVLDEPRQVVDSTPPS